MIQLFQPVLSPRAIQDAQEVLRSGWLGSGPRTKEFESAFASYCEADSCVAMASASDALRVAMALADVADTEVVTTALTYVASTNAILHAGATPVFADVQPTTGNLDPADVERCITERTSALLVVHYGGCPADLAELRSIADRHGVRVIEDCAHATGSTYRGAPIGSGGDLHAFSFSAVKNLTGAGGGALVCSSADDAQRARRLRSHGVDRESFDRVANASRHWDYEVLEPGFGCAMGDVHAAIASAQLLVLDVENARRREIAQHYRRRLGSVAGLQLTDVPVDRETNDHMFVVLAEARDALIDSLFAHDIIAGVHYRRVDSHVPYKLAQLPMTEWFSTQAVSLPMHLALSDDDVDSVCDVIEAGVVGMTDRPLVVLGNHILSVDIADVAEQSGWTVSAFVENLDRARCRETLEGLPVIWIDEPAEMKDSHLAVFGLGTTRRSRFTDEAAALGMSFATVIHPTAVVSPRSTVGAGSVIGIHTVVAARSTIGEHVLMNRGSMVGHHTRIDDHVSVQPGAIVAGMCTVGAGTWIGIGATVIDRISVGRDVVVGAGAVVTKDVPDAVQVVGVPARVVKEGITGR